MLENLPIFLIIQITSSLAGVFSAVYIGTEVLHQALAKRRLMKFIATSPPSTREIEEVISILADLEAHGKIHSKQEVLKKIFSLKLNHVAAAINKLDSREQSHIASLVANESDVGRRRFVEELKTAH